MWLVEGKSEDSSTMHICSPILSWKNAGKKMQSKSGHLDQQNSLFCVLDLQSIGKIVELNRKWRLVVSSQPESFSVISRMIKMESLQFSRF